MTLLEHAARRRLMMTVLARRAGPAGGAEAIAAAADLAYDDLVRVVAPIIGDVGVKALTDRAVHLTKGEYPWLVFPPGHATETFDQIIDVLKQQDPAAAGEAAAAVFAAILGLLATFIGEPLATRLVRQTWPDGFSSANTEET